MNDNRSDILLTLENIETLCGIYHNLHNSYAGAALIVTIMTEAHTLSLKLQQMGLRWQEHMPFREAYDVKFDYWHGRIQELGNQFLNDELPLAIARKLHSGNRGIYLLDLYDLLPLGKNANGELIYKEDPYFQTDTLNHYLERVEKMRAAIAGNYDECLRSVSRFVVREGSVKGLDNDTPDVFWNMLDIYLTNRHCSGALFRLAEELNAIRQWIDSRHGRTDLERLADRVFLQYGSEMRTQAQTDLTKWENTCPDEDLISECQLNIDLAIEQLKDWEFGAEFKRFVKPNVDLRLQRGTLGKFFFTFRDRLEEKDVKHIIYCHYQIQYYKEYLEKREQESMLPMEDMGAPAAEAETCIQLPTFFEQELRDNEKQSRRFVSLLGTVEAKINCGGSETYKWSHVLEALKRLQLVPKGVRNVDFCRFIHSLFSNRTVASVNRDLYRGDKDTFEQTVGNLIKIFKPVHSAVFEK